MLFLSAWSLTVAASGQCSINGIVRGPDGPVPYANVVVAGTVLGVSTDADGRFELRELPCERTRIAASAVGYQRTERLFDLQGGKPLDAVVISIPSSSTELEEVVITGTMREVLRSESPIPVEVITPAFLRRNPSPALFDAVGQVNGVRPQINCSVCNTGDIHINGMEGPYTMVLIDGMPIVSGLSTVYGLSGIPTSLVERMEVVKGPGSALYGSEAMGGIINVITKGPVLAPLVSADAMSTSWGEHNVDLGLRLGEGRLKGLLGVNGYRYGDPRDDNGDGFTDVTLQERVSIFNKLSIQRPDRKQASLAARYVHEDRWGGDMDWTPAFAGGDSVYGESIATRRWEIIGQYHLPVNERVLAQVSFNNHDQRSWYGIVPFNAAQRVLFGQVHWSRKFGAGHEALTGIALRHTFYNDNTVGTSTVLEGIRKDAPQRKPLPGFFVQDEWRVKDQHALLLGYRLDHDRDHGLVHSPRMAWKYVPSGRLTVRASFGTGYRVVNLFTEDHAALTGSRTVVIAEDLRPERSWNGTLNLVRKWPSEKRFFAIDASIFHTRFSNRILPDYATSADAIFYRNLHGFGVAQGVNLNFEGRIGTNMKAVAGGTFMDVHTEQSGRREEQLFAPTWSGTFMLGYEHRSRTGLDLTGQWYGPMRLPLQPNDFRAEWSPWYAIVNVQVKHRFSERIEAYGGVKNLLDFVPIDPLMRPFDPFDRHAADTVSNPNGYTFDTAYMYAPMQGVRAFAGVRYTLQGGE
ncbi:MAG: TonB-dependent receptor [Flavobacteriales bacterium]|nr:TonB-dependent receptor [Flavobacteriales bacterium]